MSYDLSNCKDSDSDGLYEIPVAEGESRLPNTILMGAYMLPIKYFSEDNKPTFTLEIWGSTGITEECVQSFPVYQNGLLSGSDAEKYSIYPNYIYHIGDKPDPDDKTGDYPMSLAGTKITVKPEPWTKMDVNVDFPSVPVNATMELTYGGVSVNDDYIFDCIGTYNSIDMNEDEPLRLKVNPSVLGTSWELFIAAKSGVYVKNPVDNKFVDGFTYKSKNDENTKGKTFDLLLTDYINISSDKPLDEDYREIKIKLTTYDKDNKPLSFVQELVIKQYNAVIINVGDSKRAFSRYDYNGSELMSTEGTAEEWGYYGGWRTGLYYVYHNGTCTNTDGFENYYMMKVNNDATSVDWVKEKYNNSLAKKATKERIKINNNGDKINLLARISSLITVSYNHEVPDIWYVPARDELANFLLKFSLLSDSQQKQSLFIQTYDANKAGYWTSNATDATYCFHAYYNYIKNDGTLLIGVDGSDSKAHTHRSSVYYARRACRIE